jgi:hypothetical protein
VLVGSLVLVVDGNGLIHFLYRRSQLNYIHGGQYQQ